MSVSRIEITPPRHEDIDWSQAECRGKAIDKEGRDLFYKEERELVKKYAPREKQAKELCRRCRILFECREYGLTNEVHGVWGGMSEQEREAWRKAMNYRIVTV